MKVRTLLAVSLALAFATGAYAQDNTSASSGTPADTASAAPTDKPASTMRHHAMKHHAGRLVGGSRRRGVGGRA